MRIFGDIMEPLIKNRVACGIPACKWNYWEKRIQPWRN